MKTVRVFVQEKKVPGVIPTEVASAFAALYGGLAAAEGDFRGQMGWPHGRREMEKAVTGRIDALEQSALSVVVSSIQAAAESMRGRIERLNHQAEFEQGATPLVLTHYPKGLPLHGCLWFRRGEDGPVELDIDLRGKDHSAVVRQLYGTAANFDEAYDRMEAERESIEALIDAMIATALDRAEEPAEG